jgi:hypothetical protein
VKRFVQARVNGGSNYDSLCRTAWKHYLYASVDGKGLRHHSSVPEVHDWISSGTALVSGAKFIAAVKVRSNTLPTRSRCSRGRLGAIKTCEICGPNVVENLSHILQACPRTHGSRIMRHDRILHLLAGILKKKGWLVQVELRIATNVGLRKPDLLAYKSGDQAWIIDATIVSDTYGDLDVPYNDKVTKYKSCPEITADVEARTDLTPEYSSICMNWRGAYSPASAADMRLLGLTRTDLTFLSAVCVEQGGIIHRVHQRSNVRSIWA